MTYFIMVLGRAHFIHDFQFVNKVFNKYKVPYLFSIVSE